MMEFEKRHCCCCVPLPEGVMLVGIYGTSFHASLLTIQLVFDHATLIPYNVPLAQVNHRNDPFYQQQYHELQPGRSNQEAESTTGLEPGPLSNVRGVVDEMVVEIVQPIVLAAHCIGVMVNILLVIGVWKNLRHLMVPWLLLQGLLAVLMSGLAIYYLIIFPEKSNCTSSQSGSRPTRAYSTPYTSTVVPTQETPGSNGGCSILLWYGGVMVLSLVVLAYYFYIVCEFASQMYSYHGLHIKNLRQTSDSPSESPVPEYQLEYQVQPDHRATDMTLKPVNIDQADFSPRPQGRRMMPDAASYDVQAWLQSPAYSNDGKSLHVVQVLDQMGPSGERFSGGQQSKWPVPPARTTPQPAPRGPRKNVSFVDDEPKINFVASERL